MKIKSIFLSVPDNGLGPHKNKKTVSRDTDGSSGSNAQQNHSSFSEGSCTLLVEARGIEPLSENSFM